MSAEDAKARGDALFQAADYSVAAEAYTEALALNAGSLTLNLHKNLAACLLKLARVHAVCYGIAPVTCM